MDYYVTLWIYIVPPSLIERYLRLVHHFTSHAGLNPHPAIVVPSTAVIQNGKDTFVFVETAPGKYTRRNVTLGTVHDTTDEVTQGLEDGDKVVSTGAELLRESEE